MFSSSNPKFFAVRRIHYPVNPSNDYFHTDAVVPSSDHCRTEIVLSPSDHYCMRVETVPPSGDHYCIDLVVPSSDHCCTETVLPSSDHYFFIFSHFYAGSMCLMRRLHLGRSCASSSDNPLSDKSFLMLSNHLRFGLPLLLFPGTSIPITLFPTYSSSLLETCPYHFNLLSCTFLDISPTFVVPLILSFLILFILVTPLIHLNIPPHPTSSRVLSSLPTSRHRASLLVLQLSCILSPWLSNVFFGRRESPISSSSFSILIVFYASSPHLKAATGRSLRLCVSA